MSLALAPLQSVSVGSQLTPPQIGLVTKGLQEAWRRLNASPFRDYADEKKVTSALMHLLNGLLDEASIPGFDYGTFETITIDNELWDYSHTLTENKPDLAFRLSGRFSGSKTYAAMFAECKVLDKKRGLGLYVKEGLIRFVQGRYAWAVSHGMMVGYFLQTRLDARSRLTRYMAKYNHSLRALDVVPVAGFIDLSSWAETSKSSICYSDHPRRFTLKGGSPPGDIRIYHIWLSR